jgi:hypothetical protein
MAVLRLGTLEYMTERTRQSISGWKGIWVHRVDDLVAPAPVSFRLPVLKTPPEIIWAPN